MKENKSGKKWLFILALFIIFIMVFSSFMIGLDENSSSSNKYNGHRFYYQNNQWVTIINNHEFAFNFHPSEVDSLNFTHPENLQSPLIYVSFDPDNTHEYIELSRLKLDLTSQLTSVYFAQGVLKPSAQYDLPQISCQNATPYTPVIFYQKANQTAIEYNQNCYILQAENNLDFVRLTERLIYQITGVIDGRNQD